MNGSPSHGPPPHPHSSFTWPGYKSYEARKKFNFRVIAATVAYAVFFLVAMSAVMAVSMFTMVSQAIPDFEIEARSVTHWRGGVWYVAEAGELTSMAETKICRLDEDGPRTYTRVPVENIWLLPDGEVMWVVGDRFVGKFDGTALTDNLMEKGEGWYIDDCGRPFLFGGKPARFIRSGVSVILEEFNGSAWDRLTGYPVSEFNSRRMHGWEGLPVAVEIGSDLHVFWFDRDSIFYYEGLPEPGNIEPWDWVLIDTAESCPVPCDMGGKPAIIWTRSGNRRNDKGPFAAGCTLTGKIKETGGWEERFSEKISPILDVGVYPTGGEGDFLVFVNGPFQKGELFEVENWEGKDFNPAFQLPFFAYIWFWVFGLNAIQGLLAVCFAVFVARQIRLFKISEYTCPSGSAELASLSRRAVARTVDAAVTVGPYWLILLFAMPVVFANLLDFSGPAPVSMLIFSLLAIAGFAWMLLWFCAFIVTEGLWGTTLGKWLAGIKVVNLNLGNCGLGASIARNTLRIADYLFLYLLGVLFAAFTTRWQRVGDIAAQTIVVKKDSIKPAASENTMEKE